VTAPADPPRCRNGACVHMHPGLCLACTTRVAGWVADLPGLWVAMHARLGRSQAVGEPVSGSHAPPLPVVLDVLSFIGPAAGSDRGHLDQGDLRGPVQDGHEPMLSQLTEWVRLVREKRSLTAPDRTAAGILGFLDVHGPWISGQPWADEYAQELHGVWAQAMTYAGAWPGAPEPVIGVYCPRCDAAALYRLPGQDGRLCDAYAGGCGLWLDDAEYGRWLGLSAHWAKEAV
jgi:hypothetical protein